MDRFDRNALIGLAVMCAIIITLFYIGTALGKSLEGTDAQVGDAAAAAGHGTPHASLYELNQDGEYVGFTTVGLLSGFAIGYLWVMAFDETSNKRGTTDGWNSKWGSLIGAAHHYRVFCDAYRGSACENQTGAQKAGRHPLAHRQMRLGHASQFPPLQNVAYSKETCSEWNHQKS